MHGRRAWDANIRIGDEDHHEYHERVFHHHNRLFHEQREAKSRELMYACRMQYINKEVDIKLHSGAPQPGVYQLQPPHFVTTRADSVKRRTRERKDKSPDGQVRSTRTPRARAQKAGTDRLSRRPPAPHNPGRRASTTR